MHCPPTDGEARPKPGRPTVESSAAATQPERSSAERTAGRRSQRSRSRAPRTASCPRRIEVTRVEPVEPIGIDTDGRPVGPTRRGRWTVAAGTFRATLPECDCDRPPKQKWLGRSTGPNAVYSRMSVAHCYDGWHAHQVDVFLAGLAKSFGGNAVVVTIAGEERGR